MILRIRKGLTACSICLVCVFFSLHTSGQSRISGKVESEEGPVAFANVLLLSAKDSVLVKGMVTNEHGRYQINHAQQGRYLILATMMGYKKAYSEIFSLPAGGGELGLKTITLAQESKQLNEITVEASKPLYEQQVDKLVINVQSSITAAGSTALDVLERSPGISLNRQNNTLAMNGKTGIMVMVNGKLSRMPMESLLQMLSGMNAANIEKIELITAPSAGYDAEGNGGIINIVLKKNTDTGTNGNYSLTMGYGWYERPAASVNLNHRSQKLNLFADGSFLWDHYWFATFTNRQVTNGDQVLRSSNMSNRNTYHLSYNGRAGFEYTLGSRTSLSGLMAGFNNKQEQFAVNDASFFQSDALHTTIQVKDHEINQWRHLMGNLNLQHTLASKAQLSVDVDYLLYLHHNPHWYINSYEYLSQNTAELERMNNSKRTPIHSWVGKADYSKSFSEKSKLEAGIKGTITRLKNNVLLEKLYDDVWQQEPRYSVNLRMMEEISAAYVNVQHSFNPTTTLQAGLRWEYTHTHLKEATGENLVNRRYHNLFPSLSLAKELNKNNSLQVSYSRRITRPTYNDLAPVFTFVDPYTSLYGNTSLMPAITHALQLGYQLRKKYLISLQYSHDANAISWMMEIEPETNEQFTYKENINSVHTYALNATVPVTIGNWWQMQHTLSGIWQQNTTDYLGKTMTVRGYSGQINSTHTFTLPKDFSLEVSSYYRARSFMGLLSLQPYGFVNLGLQKKLPARGGTLRLTVSDLFWNMKYKAVNDLPALNMYQDIGFIFEPRVVRFTYARSFGNSQIKAVKQRATGSEEERRRVQ